MVQLVAWRRRESSVGLLKPCLVSGCPSHHKSNPLLGQLFSLVRISLLLRGIGTAMVGGMYCHGDDDACYRYQVGMAHCVEVSSRFSSEGLSLSCVLAILVSRLATLFSKSGMEYLFHNRHR